MDIELSKGSTYSSLSVSSDEDEIIFLVYLITKGRGYSVLHDNLRNRQGKNLQKNQVLGAVYNVVLIFWDINKARKWLNRNDSPSLLVSYIPLIILIYLHIVSHLSAQNELYCFLCKISHNQRLDLSVWDVPKHHTNLNIIIYENLHFICVL